MTSLRRGAAVDLVSGMSIWGTVVMGREGDGGSDCATTV